MNSIRLFRTPARQFCRIAALLFTLLSPALSAAESETATQALLQRVLPGNAQSFVTEEISSPDGKEVFELESRNGKIILRGTSGVAMASALNWYLKYYCNCHVSWCGDNLNLPDKLPAVKKKIRKESPYQYRYYLNYCTHSYTMAFWDWERWEKEIDWMALQGINMPLAITGQEAVWQEVYREMGLTDDDLNHFFTGPAYLGWLWMGCMNTYGGPLPQSWIDSHRELQKKILARQRALGMKPILPAFTGHVPPAIKKKFPKAKINRLRSWGGFPGTYVMDPMDPMFTQIGRAFILKQTEMYGTDHIYSADTFIEMDPPSTDLTYLGDVSKAVYQSMASGDPKAIHVLQAWMFLHGKFWKQDRIKAYLDAVPNDRLIMLDLFATAKPQWKRTEAFKGKPWIWCMLNNWGGKAGMYGRTHAVTQELPSLLNNPKAGKLIGIGLTPEGLATNPYIYDLMTEMAWHTKPVDVEQWTQQYIRRRYGMESKNAQAAWDILRRTLYNCRDRRHGPQGAHYCMRPTPKFSRGSFVRSEIFYKPADIRKALALMLDAADELGESDTFQYDLVDLTRQCMSDLSIEMHHEFDRAYKAKDAKAFEAVGKKWLEAILDLDALLGTRQEFLLSDWLMNAKKQATNDKEKALYEWNARSLITTWGPRNSPLHDYAQKQWSGMMKGFYHPRWKMLIEQVTADLAAGRSFNQKAFDRKVSKFEEKWTRQTDSYPLHPKGHPVTEARKVFEKYLAPARQK